MHDHGTIFALLYYRSVADGVRRTWTWRGRFIITRSIKLSTQQQQLGQDMIPASWLVAVFLVLVSCWACRPTALQQVCVTCVCVCVPCSVSPCSVRVATQP